MADSFYSGRSFLTPAFEIRLEGQKLGALASADVLDISFTDDLESVPSFEFSIDDWDPVALRPKYSSPWDAIGNPLKAEDGSPLPVIEPGVRVDLYFGYRDEGELALVMEGEVVSVSTAFPAAARPVAKVRVLDRFQRALQRIWVEANVEGTDKAIVDQLCAQHAEPPVTLAWPPLDSEGEKRDKVAVDGPLFDEIASRAKAYGLRMVTEKTEGGYQLRLLRPGADSEGAVATFEWGRTLVSFTPTISAAAAVEFVLARGADPKGEGKARRIEVRRTWADVGLDESLLGAPGKGGFSTAVSGLREVIKPDDIRTEEDATRAADARLRELAAGLITGEGVSVGLPELRAGRTVELIGLGARFSGLYRVTKTVHAFGGAGYTTAFSARKEVLS